MREMHMSPAYFKIFSASPDKFRFVGQVTALDIFQNNTRDFHESGLFSSSIFGRVGSDDRLKRFGYIDIKVPVFHPRIYNHLCSLKQLYKGIMQGREYATWDAKEKDFVKSDQLLGSTGFYFFLQHWKEINFKRTSSTQRDEKIQIIKMSVETALTNKILVLPAGLRDLEVDEHGGIDQHEINDFYRTLVKISNTLSTVNDLDSPIIDKARFTLQNAFNELHGYLLSNVTKGKGSFMSAKFGRRKIRYGTRNVFASVSAGVVHLDDPLNMTPNDTQIGIFQAMKATEPLMIHHLKRDFLDRIFAADGYASLIDPKTLNRVEVTLKPRLIDAWTTVTGLTKVINTFQNPSMRHKPVMLDKHYLGLIYKKDGIFKVVFSLDEIPQDQLEAKSYIEPITYGELFYILCSKYIGDLPCDITRYPIEGAGSIYPSYCYLLTTLDASRATELDDAWQPTDNTLRQFPNKSTDTWIDTMGPHVTKVTNMGADYDGDTGNANINMSSEAIEATKSYLSSMQAHIDTNGNMFGSPLTDIPVRVAYNLAGD